MNCVEFADKIARRLQTLIMDLPEGFYESFAFTQTGNTLTHPVTLGILSRILWDMPEITHVAVDLRLNLGDGVKFQPDLGCLGHNCAPVAFVDYESPNSSDARVLTKDVDQYLEWQRSSNENVPYVIITTLPDGATENWKLLYISRGRCNEPFRGRRNEVRRNPLEFWYAFFSEEFSKRDMGNIALVNIDGKAVRRVYPA